MKIPFSSVRISKARPPANSGVSQTLAPICGFPPGSTTTPVSLPKLCAARDEPTHRRIPRKTKVAVFSDFNTSPRRRGLRRNLFVGRSCDRELRGSRNTLIGHCIRRLNLDPIFTRGQGLGRDRLLNRQLLA